MIDQVYPGLNHSWGYFANTLISPLSFHLQLIIISVACTGQFYAGGCQNTPLHQPAGKSIVLKSQPAYLSWWTWRAGGGQAG